MFAQRCRCLKLQILKAYVLKIQGSAFGKYFKVYYKVRQVVQSASDITKSDRLLLESASGIKKCDRLY